LVASVSKNPLLTVSRGQLSSRIIGVGGTSRRAAGAEGKCVCVEGWCRQADCQSGNQSRRQAGRISLLPRCCPLLDPTVSQHSSQQHQQQLRPSSSHRTPAPHPTPPLTLRHVQLRPQLPQMLAQPLRISCQAVSGGSDVGQRGLACRGEGRGARVVSVGGRKWRGG
jgi:hypothetical protein